MHMATAGALMAEYSALLASRVLTICHGVTRWITHSSNQHLHLPVYHTNAASLNDIMNHALHT
jgi:hypothetical protein